MRQSAMIVDIYDRRADPVCSAVTGAKLKVNSVDMSPGSAGAELACWRAVPGVNQFLCTH